MSTTETITTGAMRLRSALKARSNDDSSALVTYLMAGYPTLEDSLQHIRAAAASGADVIEIGIPHSDPIADGPLIQEAANVALENGFELPQLIAALQREPLTVPYVLMSYINPLLAYGFNELMADLQATGCCGLIVPDLPLEEALPWAEAARDRGLALVHLVAPTSTDARLRAVMTAGDGFVYAVSVAGITGTRDVLPNHIASYLQKIKTFGDLPVAVGFGISTPAQVAALRQLADGVVVGSRLIRAVRDQENLAEVVADLAAATEGNTP